MKKNKHAKKSKTITNVALVFFIGLFLFSGYMFLTEYMDKVKSAEEFEELAELVQEEPRAAEEGVQISAAEKYAPLKAQNSDFTAWIRIDGTAIDYPVVHHPTEVDYYLKRGFDRNASNYGVPYLKEECTLGVSDNCTIYGHHMRNGSMFSDLCKYESPNFYEEHKIIHLDTLEEYGEYQVVFVFKSVAYTDNEFRYFDYITFDSPEVFDRFVSGCRALQLYDTGEPVQFGDKFITLSTCEYSKKNGRMVVVARKLSV